MTSLTQAQALLRRWREAAGEDCGGTELTWVLGDDHMAVESMWYASLRINGEEVTGRDISDPLTAVREAIKQTPFQGVSGPDAFETLLEDANREISKLCHAEADVLPAMNPLARIAQLEKSRKSLIAAFDLAHRDRTAARRIYASDELAFENAKLTAELASRDARIEELEDSFVSMSERAEMLERERDAAREQYRGLREGLDAALRDYALDSGYTGSFLKGFCRTLLDRFPAIEETAPDPGHLEKIGRLADSLPVSEEADREIGRLLVSADSAPELTDIEETEGEAAR